ncbi:formate--tetrahydrofolate ligase [Natronobacterium gregoryi]|uniref:Formate--tetrahydrofolate ligase n=2 Tax=Natronobacterium gregoryi TaxID=44930 RepID=L0ADB0_NATGS|nr:formate--tetrahydrofolate ligase [Natronobacterium gregoryi]AFZ71898.1 formyltetrahydrofolate synthetase [Natronobacterium gregoryi SP2]ELY62481.1 Formate-tetrahydrofolate ligase [Natronobacterium gregoryi SP2]PLK20683.1 formate--tetrahydrofolate ligase [Natronobacterium gregoryi SP2]SFJ14533.1 Formate-tetrahydrofolate ligase [Natronobacterium gregoryi]
MTTPSSDEPIASDAEIARTAEKTPIEDVVAPLGLEPKDLEPYGDHVVKLAPETTHELTNRGAADARYVLVTGMTPTPRGEGKTVTNVGLAQAFDRLGKSAVAAVREPSLGPVFGIKGGAAGGGYSQVLPMEDINLHFTGDLHAITSAHNLISATLDNHVHQGNDEGIDVTEVVWPRAIDANDRALRELVVGLGGSTNGKPREGGFVLTAASELMAVLCLADSVADLKERIGRIVVAYDVDDEPVTVDDLGVTGAVAVLLKDAFQPNVVGTIEGTPAFVHGGPFANIAHGTNSIVADKIGGALADYVVTEAGFGADLGAEKFFDIVAPAADLQPAAATLVVSVRALKCHGKDMWPVEFDALEEPDVEAVRAGFENLDRHVSVLQKYGVPVVVAVNRFPGDTDEEVDAILEHCHDDLDVRAAESTVHRDGGEGGIDLAEAIDAAIDAHDDEFSPLYEQDAPVEEKIRTVATEVYGADSVTFTADARDDLERLERVDLETAPVCLSKTPYSFSDDSSKNGAPEGWELTVRELRPSAGAGFVVALTGDVLTMPGLPSEPAALEMDLEDDGTVTGLF